MTIRSNVVFRCSLVAHLGGWTSGNDERYPSVDQNVPFSPRHRKQRRTRWIWSFLVILQRKEMKTWDSSLRLIRKRLSTRTIFSTYSRRLFYEQENQDTIVFSPINRLDRPPNGEHKWDFLEDDLVQNYLCVIERSHLIYQINRSQSNNSLVGYPWFSNHSHAHFHGPEPLYFQCRITADWKFPSRLINLHMRIIVYLCNVSIDSAVFL